MILMLTLAHNETVTNVPPNKPAGPSKWVP